MMDRFAAKLSVSRDMKESLGNTGEARILLFMSSDYKDKHYLNLALSNTCT
jgi:hypothetical protein